MGMGKRYLTNGELNDLGMGSIKFTKRERSVLNMGKINLPKRKRKFIISEGNGVRGVNWVWTLILGVLIGLALPFLIDWAMFGNPIPCHSVKVFEDGSSIQACEVRK